MRKIVIVGATSAIAEHCARLWLLRDGLTEMVLLGRDKARLDAIAADLRVRSPRSLISVVALVSSDFVKPEAVRAEIDAIASKGDVDIALIAHGSLPSQKDCQNDLRACANALEINGVSPILFAEAFAGHMEKAGKGRLAVIGSVAGDRGKQSNYVYGAAKAMVDVYVQGLRHRFAQSGGEVKAIIVKPGPTDTPMTAEMKNNGARLAPVAAVAKSIVDGIDAGKGEIYAPWIWRWIMLIISHLPAAIFNRMKI